MFVVLEVCFENMPQGSFVEDNYVVQALPSQGADETLRIRVLPGASRCCQHFADAHFSNSLTECCSVNAISIMQQITRRAIPRKRFRHLLARPFSCGLCRN